MRWQTTPAITVTINDMIISFMATPPFYAIIEGSNIMSISYVEIDVYLFLEKYVNFTKSRTDYVRKSRMNR